MFKEIPPFTSQEIIDTAFRKASKKGKNDLEKITLAADTISSMLELVIKRYPSFEHMDQFLRELIDITVGEDKIKHHLGALQWASLTVGRIKREYLRRMRRSRRETQPLLKQCYARYSSVVHQVGQNLEFLREARTSLTNLPSVNADVFTVVLAGCPNVGKTSILKALTGSEPEIQPYPFTTQGINVGYFEHRHTKIQVVDTPGLLDRPLSRRNWIERQAISALTHLADVIVYIYDVSQSCGYSTAEQEHLLEDVKAFNTPLIIVNNKSDLRESEHLNISTSTPKGIEDLRKRIEEYFLASIP